MGQKTTSEDRALGYILMEKAVKKRDALREKCYFVTKYVVGFKSLAEVGGAGLHLGSACLRAENAAV